jgi:putative endonuclease
VYYVYILRSKRHPAQTYVGSTRDLRSRLKTHNSGGSTHTSKFRPWELMVYIAFPRRQQAEMFERYLKTGSGRAFAIRHFE